MLLPWREAGILGTMSTPLPRLSRLRRVLAVVLSICPGAGHAVLGEWKRGVAWLGALLLMQASIPLLGLPGFVLTLGVFVGAAVDVARLPPRAEGPPRVGWVLLGLVCFWSASGVVASVTRRWLAEPFRLPSGSMQPSLYIGDQFYSDKTVASPLRWRALERGEVIVFTPPWQPQVHLVHRAVALEGDVVMIRGGQLHLSGQLVGRTPLGGCEGLGLALNGAEVSCRRYEEVLGEHRYQVLLDEGPGGQGMGDFPSERIRCPRGMETREEGCVVPPGHVFVLGDFRDNAMDSRFGGPVPVENVVAAARFVHFSWTPESGVRWSRLGTTVP